MTLPFFVAMIIFAGIWVSVFVGVALKWVALLTLVLGVVLLWLAVSLSGRTSDDVPLAIYSIVIGLVLIVVSCLIFLALAFRAM